MPELSSDLIANLIAVAVGLGVGTPILLKSLRARERAGIYLGLAVFLEGVEWLFWGISLYTPLVDTPLGEAAAVACRISIALMTTAMLLFTREAFRPMSRIATLGCCVAIAAMGTSIVASGMLGDWAGNGSGSAWLWLEMTAQLGVYVWAFSEPALFYHKMRKRAQLGLGDPVVANRILLWSIYGAGFTLSQLLWVAGLAVYQTTDTVVASAAMAGEVAVWLAFFPPKSYLKWLRRHHAAALSG